MRSDTIALALAVFLIAPGTTDDGSQKCVKAVTTQCAEIYFNKKLATSFKQKVKNSKKNLDKLVKDAAELQIAVPKATDLKTKMAYQFLGALTAKAIQEQIGELSRNSKTLEEAAVTLRQRNSQLKLLLKLRKTAISADQATWADPNDGIVVSGNNDGGKCTMPLAFKAEVDSVCDDSSKYKKAINKAPDELSATTEIAETADAQFAQPAIALNIYAHGTVGSISTPGPKKNGAFLDGSNSLGGASHGMTIKTPIAVTQLSKQAAVTLGRAGKDDRTCNADDSPGKLLVSQKATAGAICQAKSVEIKIVPRPMEIQRKTLATNSKATRLALLLKGGQIPAKPTEEQRKNAIEAIFGAEDTNIQQEFVKTLESNKVAYKEGEKMIEQTIATAKNYVKQ
ncbi:hypothetical protein DPX39_040086200 [Trypanosoma brucei equiperdum]|uniref:Variant surface glycoprotein n=1 Tax=Trypanosoma brucei equiperdum TaxID=630700 RepID=A0A3L6L9C6_9TRYP|nr:hypothetical protein DPX39_040086200 [Trypanosoma brucei equiperdum]